jgi:hypothetical protein
MGDGLHGGSDPGVQNVYAIYRIDADTRRTLILSAMTLLAFGILVIAFAAFNLHGPQLVIGIFCATPPFAASGIVLRAALRWATILLPDRLEKVTTFSTSSIARSDIASYRVHLGNDEPPYLILTSRETPPRRFGAYRFTYRDSFKQWFGDIPEIDSKRGNDSISTSDNPRPALTAKIMTGAIIFSSLLLCTQFFQYTHINTLKHRGTRTIGYLSGEFRSRRGHTPYIQYRFLPTKAAPAYPYVVIASDAVTSDAYANFHLNQPVPVIYDPANPNNARMDPYGYVESSDALGWFLSGILPWFAVITGPAFVMLIVFVARSADTPQPRLQKHSLQVAAKDS